MAGPSVPGEFAARNHRATPGLKARLAGVAILRGRAMILRR
jgi:hypothetical protein